LKPETREAAEKNAAKLRDMGYFEVEIIASASKRQRKRPARRRSSWSKLPGDPRPVASAISIRR